MTILRRFFDVAKSYTRNWANNDEPIQENDFKYTEEEEISSDKNAFPKTPLQVVEDLATFGLTPPSSLKNVKEARNREMKNYHPDKNMENPQKLSTASQIAQIYNEAFERLERHFEK